MIPLDASAGVSANAGTGGISTGGTGDNMGWFPLAQDPVDFSQLVGLDVFLFLFQLV